MEESSTTPPVLRPAMLGFMSDDEVVEDDIFTNKIGGHPLWLGDPIPEQELKCGFCGRVLVLLLQISAPLSHLPDERCVYLFACVNKKCGGAENGEAKSWKVFRMHKQMEQQQLGEDEVLEKNDKPTTNGGDRKSSEGDTITIAKEKCVDTTWGADADDWSTGGDWTATTEIDFEKLLEQKEATATQKQKQKGEKHNPRPSSKPRDKKPGEDKQPFFLPYHMDIEEEVEGGELPVNQRVKELAEQHKEDAAGGGADWNEEYEKTGDKVFMRFQETLRRNPNQILRYRFGGNPLWISTTTPAQVPRCEHCGEERVFELQVLSTLIYFLDEKRSQRIRKQQQKKKRGRNRGRGNKKGASPVTNSSSSSPSASSSVATTTTTEENGDGDCAPKTEETTKNEEEEEGLEFGNMVLYSCRNSCGVQGKAYAEYVYLQPAL